MKKEKIIENFVDYEYYDTDFDNTSSCDLSSVYSDSYSVREVFEQYSNQSAECFLMLAN